MPEKFIPALRIQMPVSQARRKFGHDEEIVPRLTDGIDNLFANAEDWAISHVRFDFIQGCCRQNNIGVGCIGRELSVDADQEIEAAEGFPPKRRPRPGGYYRRAQNNE